MRRNACRFASESVAISAEYALQNQVSSALPEYISLRDRFWPSFVSDQFGAPQPENKPEDYNQVRDKYHAAKQNIESLVREYNQLEVRLSAMEGRSPRFFVIPLPPTAPYNLRVETRKDGEQVFKWDYESDPLWIQVNNDVKALFQQYGHKFPSDR